LRAAIDDFTDLMVSGVIPREKPTGGGGARMTVQNFLVDEAPESLLFTQRVSPPPEMKIYAIQREESVAIQRWDEKI
jgi:hypothetical protein